MNKRKKLTLSRESIRSLTSPQLGHAAGGSIGGTTDSPTCTITDGTTPYPSHGPCSMPCAGSAVRQCY